MLAVGIGGRGVRPAYLEEARAPEKPLPGVASVLDEPAWTPLRAPCERAFNMSIRSIVFISRACLVAFAGCVLAQDVPLSQPPPTPLTNQALAVFAPGPSPVSTDFKPIPAAPEPTLAAPVRPAAVAKAKSKPKPVAAPGTALRGTVIATDRATMTLTVDLGHEKIREYRVSSKTRFTRDGKPGIFADVVVGEDVAGYSRKVKDGPDELVVLRIGVKAGQGKK